MQRNPAVSGHFYPGDPAELKEMLREFMPAPEFRHEPYGIISPHAGYPYSGAIAGQTFSQIKVPERAIILGPNHHGYGHPWAVYPQGCWLTPLGECPIDTDLVTSILEGCPGTGKDKLAHKYEHSLEVQLPFLQILSPDVKIVPICLSGGSLEALLEFGKNLGRVIKNYSHPVLMVASSDMTHYEPDVIARDKDMKAIKQILALDPAGLWETVRKFKISMCGVLPVVIMLSAAEFLGATKATLVHYGSSGDVTQDFTQVVGYAGVLIE
jgi:AmmeMemoRadiSam system protein B